MKVEVSSQWTDEEKLSVIAVISLKHLRRPTIQYIQDMQLINQLTFRNAEFLELNRRNFEEYIVK